MFPTQEAQGLLWVWGESGPSAAADSAGKGPALIPEMEVGARRGRGRRGRGERGAGAEGSQVWGVVPMLWTWCCRALQLGTGTGVGGWSWPWLQIRPLCRTATP